MSDSPSKSIELHHAYVSSDDLEEIGGAIMDLINERFSERGDITVQAALVYVALSVGTGERQVSPADTVAQMAAIIDQQTSPHRAHDTRVSDEEYARMTVAMADAIKRNQN